MLIVEKKKHDETNMYYGVDLNDKKAVEREFRRRNNIHRLVTLIAIIVMIGLGVVFFDFYRVNFMGGRPLFATYTRVKNGTLFNGLGYSVLYCNNGERHVGAVLYTDCESVDPDSNTFKEVLARSIKSFAEENKLSSKGSIDEIVINEFYHDEDVFINKETIEDKIKKKADEKKSLFNPNKKKESEKNTNELQYADYYVDFGVKCKKGDNCLNLSKDFHDMSHIRVVVRFDWYNDVSDIIVAKSSGEHYNKMNEEFSEKIKEYLNKEGKADLDNIRSFKVMFLKSKGQVKFRGNSYADSYLVQLNYMCNDSGNTCVTAFDKEDEEGDFSNLSFQATMFLDASDNVVFMGPKEYYDM